LHALQVRILYFAGLRESLQRVGETVQVPDQVRTAGELRDWLVARGEPFSQALGPAKAVRMAVEQTMANARTPLTDNAEVAFFPPVTGG
jgi:molybdopterin synthase sulfur carrier subunit